MDDFGTRLRKFAKAAYGNQKKLAEVLGMSDGQLSDMITERTGKPKAETLVKLAEAGASIDWLLTGQGVMMLKADDPDAKIKQAMDLLAEVLADREEGRRAAAEKPTEAAAGDQDKVAFRVTGRDEFGQTPQRKQQDEGPDRDIGPRPRRRQRPGDAPS